MKFSANSLKKLYKGACYFETNRGYVIAYKYCKNQIDLLNSEGYDEFWRDRGLFSAGIRLELITSSDFIAFDYKAVKGTPLCDFPVFIIIRQAVCLYKFFSVPR